MMIGPLGRLVLFGGSRHLGRHQRNAARGHRRRAPAAAKLDLKNDRRSRSSGAGEGLGVHICTGPVYVRGAQECIGAISVQKLKPQVEMRFRVRPLEALDYPMLETRDEYRLGCWAAKCSVARNEGKENKPIV